MFSTGRLIKCGKLTGGKNVEISTLIKLYPKVIHILSTGKPIKAGEQCKMGRKERLFT